MNQRIIVCNLGTDLVLNFVAIHTLSLPIATQVSGSSLSLIPFLFLVGSIAVVLLGLFFIIKGQSFRLTCTMQKIAEFALFLILVAVTGATGNAVQIGTMNALGGNVTGMLIGGAVGGVIAGIGALANQSVGTLSSARLTALGIIMAVVFGVICIITLFTILVGNSWP